MKNMKKLVSLLLAVCLMASLAIGASAAEPTTVDVSGGTGTSSVSLSSTSDGTLDGDPAATKMNVTIPTILPIAVGTDGTVTTAGWNAGGYGNMVDIDHGNGIMTRYGHAMQVVVVPGQHVRRGQVIAYMGSTGFSTGPHVHYEVRVNGTPVNPVGYL